MSIISSFFSTFYSVSLVSVGRFCTNNNRSFSIWWRATTVAFKCRLRLRCEYSVIKFHRRPYDDEFLFFFCILYFTFFSFFLLFVESMCISLFYFSPASATGYVNIYEMCLRFAFRQFSNCVFFFDRSQLRTSFLVTTTTTTLNA